MTLLQIISATATESISSNIASRLGDQLLCIILLLSFALYSIKRTNALEKKFDEYMKTDREKLEECIRNNTKALEIFENRH